uniref:glycine dehydrogenase (aminomethyl-transferring) n=1 Tax=Fervidicoccus fontis TaxID=683846 RepID=A0A7J3ZLC2_9CREN
MSFRQAAWEEPLLLEYSGENRTGFMPIDEEAERLVSSVKRELGNTAREKLDLPELSELEVVRHFTRLAQQSYGVDIGPVPLGSCTMKYNPRLAWKISLSELVLDLHPVLLEEEVAQGVLEIMYDLQEWFKELTGMDECSLQPPAGASGELAGILMIRKHHYEHGWVHKNEILIPDNAHGSNPASASMGGFRVVRIPTDSNGQVDLEALRHSITENVAGMMLTNPNTLGLFEEKIAEISRLVHEAGGLLYYDGANLNGILGIVRPGDMGFDIVHLNIHKTFSAPHGSGGPGAGVVCAKGPLKEYLPGRIVVREGGRYKLKKPAKGVGEMSYAIANIPALIYSYIFILGQGLEGLRAAAVGSILASNYFIKLVSNVRGISLPFNSRKPRFHELVISVKKLTEETGVSASDIARYLLDRGLHAPITYFPLIVEEALMIEFTETETIENIERYAQAVKEAVELAYREPDALKNAPVNTTRKRLDAVRANHPATVTPSYKVAKLREEGKLE